MSVASYYRAKAEAKAKVLEGKIAELKAAAKWQDITKGHPVNKVIERWHKIYGIMSVRWIEGDWLSMDLTRIWPEKEFEPYWRPESRPPKSISDGQVH
jgi:hypothetical protein